MKNSYIFLPKQDNYKSKPEQSLDSLIHAKLSKSVHSILKQNFNINTNDINHNGFFKEEIKTIVKADGFDFEVLFSINNVVDNTYVDVIVTNKSKVQSIKCLEYINGILNGSSFEKYFIVIVSYDAISEYYCNKIYPRLNEIERTLRKLLFNIYIVNFGRCYYTKTVKPELQNKVKGVVQAKGNDEKKEIERLKMFFYSLEYVDIQTMLFESRWTSIEEQLKNDFLNKHSNLAELTDKQLRTALESISPKSDWERFFNDKVYDIDVNALINDIRLSRNNIAHCKFFYKREYQVCTKSITKLKKAIDKAIILTEEKDFTQKNIERYKGTFAGLSNTFVQFQKTISEAIAPLAQRTAEFVSELRPTIQRFQYMMQGINFTTISELSQLSANLYKLSANFYNCQPNVKNTKDSSDVDANEISLDEKDTNVQKIEKTD